ncbi:hypothetical protein GQX74_003284 [Glossina fuscipes]|nr:hypothetical protein GQX74_003284 [Glossina fuscipes]
MTEARQLDNAIDSARYAKEMIVFMKEKDVNPLKNMIVPLAQAPLFITFFMSLRAMANTPVESMRNCLLFSFTNLTITDPTFLLPIILQVPHGCCKNSPATLPMKKRKFVEGMKD